MRRGEFAIDCVAAHLSYLIGKLLDARGRKEKIRTDANKESLATNTAQSSFQRGIAFTHVVQVHSPAEIEIAISVKTTDQRLTLVVKVAFDIECAAEGCIAAGSNVVVALRRTTREALLHTFFALIGNHGQHARDG